MFLYLESNMRPLISIIIPTKDRYTYLTQCIESLVKTGKDTGNVMEIVVQDNTEDNHNILPLIQKYENDIKYFHIKEPISVVENSDNVILHSSGEYVCFIGDDDSVLPNIVKVADWMKANNVEACVGTIARYNWPDLVVNFHKLHSISIPKEDGINRLVDPEKIAHNVLKSGGTSMLDLPKVYHGIVSRAALNRVFAKTQSFFPGPSPDMSNAIALAFTVKNFALIDMPFILSGFSYKSTGGQGARHRHIGRLEDIPFLPKDILSRWDNKLPRIWTSQTIWAQSALESLKRMDLTEQLQKFNYNSFYGTFITFNWRLRNELKSYVKSTSIIGIANSIFKNVSKRANFFIKNIIIDKIPQLSTTHTEDGIKDLHHAVIAAQKYSENKDYSLPIL